MFSSRCACCVFDALLSLQLKLARDPLKHLVHLNEVATLAADAVSKGFEALDVDKEAGDELDHRLKWLGLFHKRKHHYGRFMLRLKLPGGIVTAAQLRYLAGVIAAYGDDGCCDVTTRQNIQLRGITLPDVPSILEGVAAHGMTSLQSGLDNVRNAVGNPLAGVDPHEILDTRPFTAALHDYVTNRGRGNPEVSNLPRKWNVCVVGSHELWEHPHINDLAYVPATSGGVQGFNIIVGGYISTQRAAESIPLDVWVPGDKDTVVALCHAILTVFRDYGTRGNRQKCRMLWLVEEMGVETFRGEVAARMPGGQLPRAVPSDQLQPDWQRRSYFGVNPQKQPGLNWVGCNVPGGRLDAADMAAFADLAEGYGCGELRLTVEQNVLLVGVPDAKVAALLAEPLLERFTPFPGRLMAGLVACTGAQFCGFSQIETKQTAWRVAEHLESVLDLPRDMRMYWTGCPNSCGQVQVADIGLMGCMVKAPPGQTGMVPGVDVFVGGRAGQDSHLATVTHPSVPMADLLPLLQRILVDTFGATVKPVPTPNRQLHTRFRISTPAAGAKAAPKGTPKKAGNATHICADCGYIYNQTVPLAQQAPDFTCPQCGAAKDRFRPLNDSSDAAPRPAGMPTTAVALQGQGIPVTLRLTLKEQLTHDAVRLRFALPSEELPLGLPVGNHILLSYVDASGATISRPYTPVSDDSLRGAVDLVVKVYRAGANARFPAGGAMSQHLDGLALGATVAASGPAGRINYRGRGLLAVTDYASGAVATRSASHIGMVAGGSGITPILAVIRAVLNDPADVTRLSLLYANQTPGDVLLRAELDAIAAAHPNFRVHYTVDRVPEGSAEWGHSVGFVTPAMMAAHLPPPGPDTQLLLCGPPAMMIQAVTPALTQLGYTDVMHLSF